MSRTSIACLAIFALFSVSGYSQQQQIYVGGGANPPQRATGTISGFVVDETGAPVEHAMVQAMGEIRNGNGAPRPMTFGGSSTDARGHFTIEVPAGQSVIVGALPPPQFRSPGSPPPTDQPVYAITYHPDATIRNQAQSVVVAEGAEQTIMIELRRVQPFRVRGSVVSNSGRSPAGLNIALIRTFGSSTSSNNGATVQQDGTFDIGGVAPGHYGVTTRVSMDPNAEFAAREIDVVDHDVDVALTLGTGGSIAGRIVFEGVGPGAAPLGANISLMPMPGQLTSVGRPMGPIAIADDWTFQANGLYGRLRIGVPMAIMREYRPLKFVFDGRDIGTGMDGIDVREGEHQLIMYFSRANTLR
jgi:hypothetical protein